MNLGQQERHSDVAPSSKGGVEPRLPEATLLWGHTEVTKAENPVAAEQRSYDATDFEGLYEYLELSCNGVGLMACEIGASSADLFAFFGRANMCLLANQCLTYHQVLLFREEYADQWHNLTLGLPVKALPPPSPKERHAAQEEKLLETFLESREQSLDDLQLAEINHLCIRKSVAEPQPALRQDLFEYCLADLKQHFREGRLQEAIDASYITSIKGFSAQMMFVALAILMVMAFSCYLMLRFLTHETGDYPDYKRATVARRGRRRTRKSLMHVISDESDHSSLEASYRPPRQFSNHSSVTSDSSRWRGDALFQDSDRFSGLSLPLLPDSANTSECGRSSR